MRKSLTNNWGLKLISFIFAVLLWLVVVNIDNPVKTKSFDNISVKLMNTNIIKDEGKVYEVLDSTDTITVAVSAPRSYLELLSKDDIVAVADFNNITAANTINITYYSKRYNDKITNFKGSFESVKLSIEPEKMLKLVLKTSTVGVVEEDYVVGKVTTDQNQVRISGPESLVSQIKSAVVSVDVSGTTTDIVTYGDVKLYDADGKEITGASIKKNVDSVKVSVEILATKTVPIKCGVTGTPAEGYRLTGVVSCTPSEIKIAGDADVLKNVSQIEIPAEAVDVTGQTENLAVNVSLKSYLPEGTQIVDSENNGRAEVVAYIEEVQEKELRLGEGNIIITNVPEGYKASLEEDSEPVLKISGLQADVSEVMLSDIIGTIDFAAYMEENDIQEIEPGVYTAEAVFELGENIEITEPVKLGVVIREAEEE